LKLEIYNTTPTKSIESLTGIGSLMGIERPINVGNAFKNKEADHLPCGDSEEADHLF